MGGRGKKSIQKERKKRERVEKEIRKSKIKQSKAVDINLNILVNVLTTSVESL